MITQTNDVPIVSRIEELERLSLPGQLDRAEALALDIARAATLGCVADLALRVSAAASLMRTFPDHLEYALTLDSSLRALHAAIH